MKQINGLTAKYPATCTSTIKTNSGRVFCSCSQITCKWLGNKLIKNNLIYNMSINPLNAHFLALFMPAVQISNCKLYRCPPCDNYFLSKVGGVQERRYGNKNPFVDLVYRLLMTTSLVINLLLKTAYLINDDSIYNVVRLIFLSYKLLACDLNRHPRLQDKRQAFNMRLSTCLTTCL